MRPSNTSPPSPTSTAAPATAATPYKNTIIGSSAILAVYRLNPTLPDREYVRQLASYNPQIDQEALARLLAELRQSDLSESRLVELAAEAAQWTQRKT